MQSLSSSAQSMIACTCIGTSLRAVQARAIHSTARRWKGKDAEVTETGAEGEAAATTKDAQASTSTVRRTGSLAKYLVAGYPFSDSVILTSRPILPKTPSEPYSTMDRVNRSLILPSTENFRTMFSRRSKARVQPGSIISVESYTGATPGASTSTSAFAGVLMAVKHRHQGVDNAIRVRASVGKPGVGTEVRFDVNSPWIKDIRVLRKNEGMR